MTVRELIDHLERIADAHEDGDLLWVERPSGDEIDAEEVTVVRERDAVVIDAR